MNIELDRLLEGRGARVHEVEFGGAAKDELLARLRRVSIALNKYADILFASELFVTSAERARARVLELAVGELGFPDGATLPEIRERGRAWGLSDCPLELGPYFRLQYSDQAELVETGSHKAPAGSVTVISRPLSDDDDFPKGFYLRKIDGLLWLRGYICSLDYLWLPGDRIALRLPEEGTPHETRASRAE